MKDDRKLPADDRAELAQALWDSLSDGQRAELDRRWNEHLENPDSAVPWVDVRTKLLG